MRRSSHRRSPHKTLAALPETVVGEFVAGEVHVSPRPGLRHASATSSLLGKLHPRFGSTRRGGWHILIEPELHLADDVIVPDLAGWRRERLPELPDAAFFELTPDWVCEVTSPRTARLDRMLKMPRYAELGVAHAWLVDPANKTLEAFAAEKKRWILLGSFVGKGLVRIPPFEALRFSLSSLWAGVAESK